MKNRLLIIATIAIIALTLTGCSSSSDSYRDTLNSGLEKYATGGKMTKQEYNAVKSFNDWRDKQGGKTYDDWGG